LIIRTKSKKEKFINNFYKKHKRNIFIEKISHLEKHSKKYNKEVIDDISNSIQELIEMAPELLQIISIEELVKKFIERTGSKTLL